MSENKPKVGIGVMILKEGKVLLVEMCRQAIESYKTGKIYYDKN